MFTPNIRKVALTTMEDLIKFSERDYRYTSNQRKVYCQNNGQIAFVDETGSYYVTPYRTEIHSILRNNGYTEGGLFVPNSSGEKTSERYAWLRAMANRQNWATTQEEAHKVATDKGLKKVKFECNPKHYNYREVETYLEDGSWIFTPMVSMYMSNSSEEYVGTYILVDKYTILVCDEYGRTFKLGVHTQHAYYSIVNALIDAGYTENHHPEYFVRKKEAQNEEQAE